MQGGFSLPRLQQQLSEVFRRLSTKIPLFMIYILKMLFESLFQLQDS